MISTIVSLSSIVLSNSSEFGREVPRARTLRQDDYLEKYDDKTIFYDVFHDGDKVRLSGPPLLNLKTMVESSGITSSGITPKDAYFSDLDRTQNSWVAFDSAVKYVSFEGLGLKETVLVGKSYTSVLSNSRVLVTKSKNNDLRWIREWIQFHVKNQGIDSVLLYDNSSTDYTPSDILESIQGIDGLRMAIIVEWPFKFGPQGGNWGGVKNAPWDSDYTEYGILEHARHRFLKEADLVISCDIDELVMSDDKRDVIQVMDSLDSKVIAYQGRWINNVPTRPQRDSETVSFIDFGYFNPNDAPTTQKWSIQPRYCREAIQWKTHTIAGLDVLKTKKVSHRHFRGISNNWKTQRTKDQVFDSKVHIFDIDLELALVRAGLKNLGSGEEYYGIETNYQLEPGNVRATEFMRLLNECSVDFAMSEAKAISPGEISSRIEISGRRLIVKFIFNGSSVRIIVESELLEHNAWLNALFENRPRSISGSKYVLIDMQCDFAAARIVEMYVDQVHWLISRISEVAYEKFSSIRSSDTEVPTYWWNGRVNFGDLIGPMLVKKISGRNVVNMKDNDDPRPSLVTVGSVLNLMERENIDIWGTGLIAPLHAKSIENLRRVNPNRIHAVRGWKTYKELTEKMGWIVPRIFGDPALLLPRFYAPGSIENLNITVIPHYLHANLFNELSDDFNIINVEDSAENVISSIANSKSVVSTSLHGIIVAQAYGVPWTWLRISDKTLAGDQFKFEDFFTVLDRSRVSESHVSSGSIGNLVIGNAATSASLPTNKFSFNALLDAFPSDYAI